MKFGARPGSNSREELAGRNPAIGIAGETIEWINVDTGRLPGTVPLVTSRNRASWIITGNKPTCEE